MTISIVSYDFTPRHPVAAPRPAYTPPPTTQEIHAHRETNSGFQQVRKILADRRATNPRPAFNDAEILDTIVDTALMSCDTWDDCLRLIAVVASWRDDLLDTAM